MSDRDALDLACRKVIRAGLPWEQSMGIDLLVNGPLLRQMVLAEYYQLKHGYNWHPLADGT